MQQPLVVAQAELMSQAISCTNGQLKVERSNLGISSPAGQTRVDRGEFRQLLKELESQAQGLTSENLTGSTCCPEGQQIEVTLHKRTGDPQSGDWAEIRVETPGEMPVNLQMGTWALRELSQQI